jgi:uncharacterized protein
MAKSFDTHIHHDLERMLPDIAHKYGVSKLGYFNSYISTKTKPKTELNVIVELRKPLGWKFFELKEYLEAKLMTRIDVVTASGLKSLYREQILGEVKWL